MSGSVGLLPAVCAECLGCTGDMSVLSEVCCVRMCWTSLRRCVESV